MKEKEDKTSRRSDNSRLVLSHVADEAITKEMHDGLGRATTTTSSLVHIMLFEPLELASIHKVLSCGDSEVFLMLKISQIARFENHLADLLYKRLLPFFEDQVVPNFECVSHIDEALPALLKSLLSSRVRGREEDSAASVPGRAKGLINSDMSACLQEEEFLGIVVRGQSSHNLTSFVVMELGLNYYDKTSFVMGERRPS
ncbi:hypothetical protein Tco_0762719 [Tanacetum coccineum]